MSLFVVVRIISHQYGIMYHAMVDIEANVKAILTWKNDTSVVYSTTTSLSGFVVVVMVHCCYCVLCSEGLRFWGAKR